MAKTPSADHSSHLHPAAAGGAAAVDPNPTAVQIVRSLAVIPTSAIPAVDDSYKAVPKEEMDPLLKIEGKQVAETDKAIEELIKKGDANLQKDLGNSTPSVATFKTLYAGLVEARESLALLERAYHFAFDKYAVAQNDLRLALRKAQKNLHHEMDDKPGLATGYPNLKALRDQRSDAIQEGIANARAEKAAEKAQKGETAPAEPPGK